MMIQPNVLDSIFDTSQLMHEYESFWPITISVTLALYLCDRNCYRPSRLFRQLVESVYLRNVNIAFEDKYLDC